MRLTHLSLFSGIGGIDLAAEWAGFTTVAFVEIDKYCQKVLNKHWPDVPIIERVQDVTKERITEIMADSESEQSRRLQFAGVSPNIGTGCKSDRNTEGNTSHQVGCLSEGEIAKPRGICDGRITLISGGFPCQPHSFAGKRKGSADERNLWPEFRRVISEIRPRWVLAENVPGLFSSDSGRFFGEVVTDLAEMGYSVGWATYGAVDVGALHRRNRVFIVGYSNNSGSGIGVRSERTGQEINEGWQGLPQPEPSQTGDGGNTYCPHCDEWYPESSWEWAGEGRCPDCGEVVADTTEQGLERAEPERAVSAGGLSPQCCEISNSEMSIRRRSNGEVNTRWWYQEAGGQGIPIRGEEYWATEPDVGRVANGVPSRVDRLKCLGNAVVPQQIYPVLKGIAEIEIEA